MADIILPKTIEQIEANYQFESFVNEDRPVLEFLEKLPNNLNILEAGCGQGRFAKFLENKFPNFKIQCIDISREMVAVALKNGLSVSQQDIKKLKFPDAIFDLVHCSHIIEHLGQKDIIDSLDELTRVLKKNGYLIVRSPLVHPTFYDDIDHVRPYPPDSITNYYLAEQIKRRGRFKMTETFLWYRREAWQISGFDDYLLVRKINAVLKLFWIKFRLGSFWPNGYVLILKKE